MQSDVAGNEVKKLRHETGCFILYGEEEKEREGSNYYRHLF
jgi:hypothetical protein